MRAQERKTQIGLFNYKEREKTGLECLKKHRSFGGSLQMQVQVKIRLASNKALDWKTLRGKTTTKIVRPLILAAVPSKKSC